MAKVESSKCIFCKIVNGHEKTEILFQVINSISMLVFVKCMQVRMIAVNTFDCSGVSEDAGSIPAEGTFSEKFSPA